MDDPTRWCENDASNGTRLPGRTIHSRLNFFEGRSLKGQVWFFWFAAQDARSGVYNPRAFEARSEFL